jgi:Pyruvate/2-oxoacid:ferredoxin oxidoreductase delta subunit
LLNLKFEIILILCVLCVSYGSGGFAVKKEKGVNMAEFEVVIDEKRCKGCSICGLWIVVRPLDIIGF